ncbi:MAG: hydroxymethylbilane synthase [Actinomycetota bacterium]
MTLRLATRRSPLALIQARSIQDRLSARGVVSELVEVDTKGDQHREIPLSQMGGQGVFALEVQNAVLRGEADVAIHSAKDLPSQTMEGLLLASVPERLDAADVLVGRSLAGLGPGATVATGSPRRRALLLAHRPDLNVVELRGNMARRLAQVGQDGVDAIVTAAAAMVRMGFAEQISERLDPTWFTPQVGQGTLALETRADDFASIELLETIDDHGAHQTLLAERAFLRELGVGCTIPAGAWAQVAEGGLKINGVMLSTEGATTLRTEMVGSNPETLGRDTAINLRDTQGGASLAGWQK